MNRNAIIIQLIQERLLIVDPVRRDAVTVFLDLCRAGSSREEIAEILDAAAQKLSPEFSQAIRQVAEAHGLV